MNVYIQLAIGAIVFLGAFYFKKQNAGSKKYTRVYSVVTYFGWCIMIGPLANFMSPVIGMMFKNTNLRLGAAFQVILFILGAELFLKDAFDPLKEDSIDPTKTTYAGKNAKKVGKSDTINSYGGFKKKK